MSFNYEKLKAKADEDTKWASYSDLFMVLSFVFLLLYVVASMRSGTFSVQKQLQYQKLAHEAMDLKQQVKVYEALKDEYLQTQAVEEEKESYQELMDKLSLLQEETDQEKKSLLEQIREADQKKKALNKYQQLVRNVVNTNILQKSRLTHRSQVITEQSADIEEKIKTIEEKNLTIEEKQEIIAQNEQTIAQNQKVLRSKQKEIENLNQEMQEKKSAIAANRKIIQQYENDLDQKIKALQKSRKSAKISKEKYNQQLKKIQQEAQKKITSLENKNQSYDKVLKNVSQDLQQVKGQLASASTTIEEQEKIKEALGQQLQQTSGALAQTKEQLEKSQAEYTQQMKDLRSNHEAVMAQEKEKFEKDLKAQQLSAGQKAQKLAEYNKQVQAKTQELKRQMASLEGDLAKANERADARKKLASKIQDSLDKAGLKAEVNPNTGDVLISFGEEYFDTGKSDLKPTMTDVLQKFMPHYSESLFKDPKIADKISSVDIVGFASPTYQGKYVDPQSLDPQDRQAAQYNLDLSYKRAKSIFNYIFDTSKIEYQNQKRLLPLVKVTGRSFFGEDSAEASKAKGMSHQEFCKQFDCKKAQRVIIKFNLED